MSWDNGDNKDSGPWGKGPAGGNNNFGNSELDNILKALFKMIGGFIPGGSSGGKMSKKGIFMLILVFFVVWGATGIYKVQPDEQGIVLRFGEFTKTTPDGLHYHLPFPIEKVITPKVTRENQIEVGVRTAGEGSSIGRGSVGRDIPEESLMLTGDENIVDVDFSVQWVISNAGDYLFNIQDPEATVKAVAESSMREVVGGANLQQILTEGREQNEAAVLELMQKTLDEYGSGISIRRVQLQKVDPPEAVIGAFRDVQAARADQERLQNEADAYTNRVIPAARGESARLDPEATVKAVAESSMREVVGGANLQQILTEGREQNEAAVLELMQKTLDEYGSGISIRRVQLQKVDPPEAVIGAFRDVQAARADQERLQNEADAYTNRVIPAARGESARLMEAAEGYKNAVISDAKGEAARFLSIYNEYSKAPIVTRQRMYLETLERVYEGMDKIIIDQSESGGPGVVPYLPLDQLQKRNNQEIESRNQ